MSALFPGGAAKWLKDLTRRRREADIVQGYDSPREYAKERDRAASDRILESWARRKLSGRRRRARADYDELRWEG